MTRFALLAALVALCACESGARKGACDAAVSREIAFTQAGAQDVVTVRSFGETCTNAVGVYMIVAADGVPIWAWAAPLARGFGPDFVENDPQAMRAFLERWSQPEILSASEAPEWALLAPGQTTLDRLTYEDIRARDLPMLCHFSGTARQTCVFWEPAAGSAGHLLDRDVDAERAQP